MIDNNFYEAMIIVEEHNRELVIENYCRCVNEYNQIWRTKMRQRMHKELVNYLIFRNVPEAYRKPLRGI